MRLTSLVKTSGCAAKLNPSDLARTLEKLKTFPDDALMVGFDNSDDALVYRVRDDLVAVQSVDFFPPMVDDPYTFGMIAAANSVSDIYAMGAEPSIAMNVLCFPSCTDLDIMRAILQGGIDKAREAGVTVAGGHTVEDPIPKYGLCVTGFARPEEIFRNDTAREGDVLILTKPLGVGLINTGAKVDMVSETARKAAEASMMTLNKYAKEALRDLTIHAVTDVTGFSLAGHALEMARGADRTVEIYTDNLPILPEARVLAQQGIIPEGTYNNKKFLANDCLADGKIAEDLQDVVFDPQTSGGLLVSLPEADAQRYLRRCRDFTKDARIVGKVIRKGDRAIILRA
ncbi:MAG: selenide, water dikinase SelD [Eubacteriales bacterium]|nr:selenide, water dikinase SelD [Eubacteriales bacterium]